MHVARVTPLLTTLRADDGPAAFVTVTSERAMSEARALDAREQRASQHLLLSGRTVAFKDVVPLHGSPTRAGTKFIRGSTAEADHTIVRILRRHGAICVGKTAMSELGVSALGENEILPAPTNPFDEHRVCGGSSSGAAAGVAAGLIDLGVGTDSGGSVRLPGAWCGVVGYKPTRDLIARRGLLTFSPTLDSVGLVARTVSDVRLGASALLRQTATPASDGAVTILFSRAYFEPVDLSVLRVYDRAVSVLKVHLPTDPTTYPDPFSGLERFRRRHGSTAADEGWDLWRDPVMAAGDLASPRLRRWFTNHNPSGRVARRRRSAVRQRLMAQFASTVPTGRVLVTPTSLTEPPRFDDLHGARYDELYREAHRMLWPLNELDAPAITVPCGFTDSGLPVGLQLCAPSGRDADVLSAAERVEDVLTDQHLPTH